MYKALNAGAIGVKVSGLADAIGKATAHGFGGIEIDPAEVAQIGPEKVRAMLDQACLRAAGWGLPVDWRGSEEKWREDLKALPHLAQAASAVGCTRCSTWVLPMSDEKPFAENRQHHIERFKPIADILREHGCSLGLEFIGPKTLRDRGKHPFIHTMGDMLELGEEIGPNVGLLLDCWHWYTSGGTVEEIEALMPDRVVYVHVNDAPEGVKVDEQVDNVRCLPGETGVIDIKRFLQALKRIGYNGPVVAEPFKKELNELPSDDDRLATVAKSLDKIFVEAEL
ncbi:MAG TPA: sugar phosphate isomerase/epimerase family protein [Fimbriimonas sp.]